MSLLRPAHECECADIFGALLRLRSKSKAAQMKLCEPDVAERHLLAAQLAGNLYVYGDFAILVDEGSPWHTSKRVLIEEIIIRFRRGFDDSVERAVEQLEVIGKRRGCVAVAAGDTQIGLMTPRYLAAGYTALGSQFYKEIA